MLGTHTKSVFLPIQSIMEEGTNSITKTIGAYIMAGKNKIAVPEFLPASKLISTTMTFSSKSMIRSTLRNSDLFVRPQNLPGKTAYTLI